MRYILYFPIKNNAYWHFEHSVRLLERRVGKKLWRKVGFLGHSGVATFGISVIGMACWDAVGNVDVKSIGQLHGAVRGQVPVYASSLWLFQGVEELSITRTSEDAGSARGQQSLFNPVGEICLCISRH